MIQINEINQNQIKRRIPDLIEPYIVEELKKFNHTFFIYRCSNYIDFNHILTNEKFNTSPLSKEFINLVEKYWSAIDAIYFRIKEMPIYTKTKEYFDQLKKLSIKEKTITDIEFFEIKTIKNSELPDLSVKTHLFSKELKKYNKEISFVKVFLKGFLKIDYKIDNLNENKFNIRTHYGRKNKTIRIKN